MAKRISQFDRAIKHAFAKLKRAGGIDKLPTPFRAIIRVVAAQGVIDNGGFQFFFESDFEDQPPYSVFVDAYKEIGASDAAKLLADAVKMFSFADPHKFCRRRNEFLERFQIQDDSPFWRCDYEFCEKSDEVERLLKKYVRKHAAAFPQ
ncbi:MAG: DMP19 family protein [Planctomycetales bacterium]|nr:DMP19 family protein [Planctomycetales bacterium]